MKRLIPLLALFAAGAAASYALASPPQGPQSPSSSSTSTSAHGKSGTHGNAKCHPVNFKGTVTGGTLMVTNISHISGPAKNLTKGGSASLTVNGKVSVQAWDCGAPGAAPTQQTLFLRQLHVGGSPQTTSTTG